MLVSSHRVLSSSLPLKRIPAPLARPRGVVQALKGGSSGAQAPATPAPSSTAAPSLEDIDDASSIEALLVAQRKAFVEKAMKEGFDPYSMEAVRMSRLQSVATDPIAVLNAPPVDAGLTGPSDFDGPAWSLDASSLILALAVLLGIRESRLASERARYDASRGQGLSSLSAKVPELRRAREEFLKAEAERRVQLATERMEEAKRRAEQEERDRREREARYKAEAERENERLRQQREQERLEFETKERAMQDELAKRTEVEMRIREEMEARRREEEAQRRREEEARLAALAEEQRKREEEEARQREEERRRKEAERKELMKLRKTFALRLECSVAVSAAPKGALTAPPFQRNANLAVDISVASTFGGTSGPFEEYFEDSRDLVRRSGLAFASHATTDPLMKLAAAISLQGVSGQGPKQAMDDLEFEHWVRLAHMRCAWALSCRAHAAAQAFDRSGRPSEDHFDVRVERGCLPAEHPKNFTNATQQCIAQVQAGQVSAAGAVLRELCEEEERSLRAAGASEESPSSSKTQASTLPPALGTALMAAHFIDRSWDERPSKTMDAPAWFEQGVELARNVVREACRAAPPDSLAPASALLRDVLGEEHPISRHFADLAERNLSAVAKAAREAEVRRLEQERMQRLLEEEWPDAKANTEARVKERESLVPVPERAWALRNFAYTLSLGGPGEIARAKEMYERSLSILQAYYAVPTHPGLLLDALSLAGVLGRREEWRDEERACWAKVAEAGEAAAQALVGKGRAEDARLARLALSVQLGDAGTRLGDEGLTALSRSAMTAAEALEASTSSVGGEGPLDSMSVSPVLPSPEDAAAILKKVGEEFVEQIEIRKAPGGEKKPSDPFAALFGGMT